MEAEEGFVIQRLESLLSNGYGKDALLPIFKQFHTALDRDVENFLVEKAIDYETSGAGRTYLVMNPKKKNDIFGFFTIGLNTLYFENGIGDVEDAYPGISLYGNNRLPVYVLFLIGKNDSCPKDISMANVFNKYILSSIREAKRIIGGSFLYIDCTDQLIGYYKKLGFVEFDSHVVNDPVDGEIRLNTMIRGI